MPGCPADSTSFLPCHYPQLGCVHLEMVACFLRNRCGECLTRANGEDDFSIALRRWLGLNNTRPIPE